MSDPVRTRRNVGAYDQPFSGVGIEFLPLGAAPDDAGPVLHETGYLPENRDWNFPGVFSPFWRLCYNERRSHCMVFGEEMVELTPEHIVLVPDHCLFHGLGGQPAPTFWMAFSLNRRLAPGRIPAALLPPRPEELCLIRALEAMIERNPEALPTDEIQHYSHALLHLILARPELAWQPRAPAALERVRRHILAHLDTRLRNADLARAAGMSVESLHRAFRRHVHSTPARLVTELRVREASRLLLATGQSIEAIAEATGFPNRSYFSRVFHKITGEYPATFRRKRAR